MALRSYYIDTLYVYGPIQIIVVVAEAAPLQPIIIHAFLPAALSGDEMSKEATLISSNEANGAPPDWLSFAAGIFLLLGFLGDSSPGSIAHLSRSPLPSLLV
jgi:hypothetical protein